ncbi:MAG: 3-isopropylmalate dehydratase small subunit [bacterium]|nr:3-isopropylmalate dehydratase small subunit [bacterium]
MKRILGKAWKYRDNINTDEIIPAKYLNTSDPKELAQHCMAGIDEDFVRKISSGDLIVAGENFGCGSSREHAPWAIKEAGISCVIAKTFARIFFRNAINIGLPIVECRQAAEEIQPGDTIEVDVDAGKIINHSQGKEYKIAAYPPFMQRLIAAGGLLNYIKASQTSCENKIS